MSEVLKGLMNCETLALGKTNALAKPKHFIFPAEPIPKGRPRAAVNKRGKAFMYTPEQTRQYEEQIAKATRWQFPNSSPLQCELACFINLFCSDRKCGDIDNLAKSILDGMQKVAFGNDSQIRSLHVELFFIGEDDHGKPRSEVFLARRKSAAEYAAEEMEQQ